MEFGEFRLLHSHGDEWVELRREHHDATEHDFERQLGKGSAVFKCPTCPEQVVVVPKDTDDRSGQR